MADEKLTQLTETTDINDDDLLYVVRDPGTVPLSRGLKFSNLVAEFPDASETVEGKVELATTDEAATGTDTTRAVTPAGLLSGIVENPGGAFLASAAISTTDTYTFSTSDFPANYQHLMIRGYNLFSSSDSQLRVRFNGDTGNNYSGLVTTLTSGAATTYVVISSTDYMALTNSDALRLSTANPLMFEIKIFDYKGTTYNKTLFGTGANPPFYNILFNGLWASTAAITSITFFNSGGGDFYGTIAIYGFNT